MTHPWYYVPGRKDLTEKNLYRKHDRENRRFEEFNQYNKYCTSTSARVRLLNDWQKRTPKPLCSIPPFDCDLEAFKKRSLQSDSQKDAHFIDLVAQLKSFIIRLREQDRDAEELKEAGTLMMSTLNSLKTIEDTFKEDESEVDSKIGKVTRRVKGAKDRLLHTVHLMLKKLSIAYSALQALSETTSTTIFLPSEREELLSIFKSTMNIMQVLENLNFSRQGQFSSMFTEEAEQAITEVMSQWEEEDKMVHDLIDRLTLMMRDFIHEMLARNVRQQEDLLRQRQEIMKTLTSFVSETKEDPEMWSLLDSQFASFHSLCANGNS